MTGTLINQVPDRQQIRRLLAVPLRQQRHRIVMIVLVLAVLAMAQGLLIGLMKGFVNVMFRDAGRDTISLSELLGHRVVEQLPDVLAGYAPSYSLLAWMVPMMIAVAAVLRSWANYVYQVNQHGIALAVAGHYREQLFAALIRLPFADIRRRSPGDWSSVIMNDVMMLQNRFSDFMTAFIKDTVIIVACFVCVVWLHWQTALALLVLAPVIGFGMGRIGRRIARYAEQFQREMARILGKSLDLRARWNFIVAQGASALESRRFAEMARRYYRMVRRSILVRSAFAPVLEFVGFLTFAGLVLAIGRGLMAGLSPEVMMQFFVALGLMLRPLREFGEQISRFQETRGSLQASLEVFARLQAAGDSGHVGSGPPFVKGQLRGPVQIREVRSGYDGKVACSAGDLQLCPGKSIAIVGPSGAGKSTLLRTLAGLISPIAWDAGMSWQELTGHVSMVGQEPFLFEGTLRENLNYGLGNTPAPDTEIRRCLETVNIAAEVGAMERGVDTLVRAVQSNLSGGQVQRLVIARAMLRDAPVLMLDEATSAIDMRTEKDLTVRLTTLCRSAGKCMVAVTHRLKWLDQYDEVWFVEGGQVILKGPHPELMNTARYARFCESGGYGAADGD